MKALSPGSIKFFTFSFFLFTFSFIRCERDFSVMEKKNAPPPPKPEINLTLAEEPALTEIYLNLKMKNVEFPQAYLVTRNDSTIAADSLFTNDTLVVDTSVTPATDYIYRAYRVENNTKTDSSAVLVTHTLDTTSHDFTWEIRTFGNGSSSCFYDVAIVNESDIWAVGEIYIVDSTGWEKKYNAVHWDGQEWELKRIKTNACGGVDYPPIRTVFAFSENNILFGHTDASITYFDGVNFSNDCSFIEQINGSINKIWGTSSNDLYVVGYNGMLARYDGAQWYRLESGTDLPINDIWGATDSLTGKQIILCVASNEYFNYGKALLRIEGEQVTPVSSEGLPWSLTSVWFVPHHIYYVAGDGLFSSKRIGNVWEHKNFPIYFKDCIRGSSLNDIVVVGSNGLLSHYNGSTWKHYLGNSLPFISGHYYAVQIYNDVIIAAGYDYRGAVIAIGRRNFNK